MVNQRIKFVQGLVNSCIALMRELCDVDPYSYQIQIADRIFFSLLMGDAEEITIETARQAGKSEILADVAATAMVIFPKLAAMFPKDRIIKKFRRGIMIGIFGPIDLQSENIYSRIEQRLTSEHAKAFLSDPDIDDEAHTSGVVLTMKKSRSFCRKQTAHPKAKIESSTYHLILVDEAQDADSGVVRKSIHPMTTAVGGTIVKVGTPSAHKSDFYEGLQRNRRRGYTYGKRNYFAFDYKHAARANPYYAQSIKKERERLGEDSDEFQMAYALHWMLDRGMFVTEEQIETLGDSAMATYPVWTSTPIVVGIDLARTHDSTIVTAIWVDWEHPDEFGLFHHRVLDWLELHGEDWEAQYEQICQFVSNYKVFRIGVDAQGMGGPAAERLQVLLPHIEVLALPMNPADQSVRWTHLMQLVQRKMVRWPAHPRTKRTKKWQRFTQQLGDVEKEYKGKYLTVHAPENEKNAHDDYVDSLALGCALTKEFDQDLNVEVWNSNPLMERGMGAMR